MPVVFHLATEQCSNVIYWKHWSFATEKYLWCFGFLNNLKFVGFASSDLKKIALGDKLDF